MDTVTAMFMLQIVKVSSDLFVMMGGEILRLTQCAGKVIGSFLLLVLVIYLLDNWATPMDHAQLDHISEVFLRLSPWTKWTAPPSIITSRTVPTALMMTAVQVKELGFIAIITDPPRTDQKLIRNKQPCQLKAGFKQMFFEKCRCSFRSLNLKEYFVY